MPRSDTNTYYPSDDGWEDLGSDVDEMEWDLDSEQHKYCRPSTSQSIRTTVLHSWRNPSLENATSGMRDIAEELRPVVADKVGRATDWLRSVGGGTSGPSHIGETSAYHDASSLGKLSEPIDPTWAPDPNALSTGHTCGNEISLRRSTGDAGVKTDCGEKRPEPDALDIKDDVTLGNGRDNGENLSKHTRVPKDPRSKRLLADTEKQKAKFDMKTPPGGCSALKDAANEPNTFPSYNKHVTETRKERRARLRAEWEKK